MLAGGGRPGIDEYDRDWKTLVKQGNLYWKARNDRGLTLGKPISKTATNVDTLINEALDALTRTGTSGERAESGELCKVVGKKAIISSHIEVEGPAKLDIECEIMRKPDTTCDMLKNMNQDKNDVMSRIRYGTFDGNRENGGEGETINWKHSTQPADGKYAVVDFEGLQILDADVHGMHVDAEGSSESIWYFENIHFRHCGVQATDYPLYLYKVCDVWMKTVHLSLYGPQIGMSVFGGGPFKLDDFEFAHQSIFEQVNGVYLNNSLIEMGYDLDGLLLKGCSYWNIGTLYARIGGDNNYVENSVIKLEYSGGFVCKENNLGFTGGGRRGGSDSNRWKYIVERADANQTDNIKDNIYGDDYVVALANW